MHDSRELLITAECPCVGHCTTALGDDVCRSCLRTFEEVTLWPEMTDEQRIAVNRRIFRDSLKLQDSRLKV